jgi:hypothetical protein
MGCDVEGVELGPDNSTKLRTRWIQLGLDEGMVLGVKDGTLLGEMMGL